MAVTKKVISDYDEQASPDPADLVLIEEDSGGAFKSTPIGALVASKLASISTLSQSISDPPEQAEVEAIQTRLNDLITALKA